MSSGLRVALTGVASILLLAAGEAPTTNGRDATPALGTSPLAHATATPQLASFTSPAAAPVLEAILEDAAATGPMVSADAPAERPSVGSLRELVDAINELPEVEPSREMRCLATAVYFEAKGEPLEGQLAVAQVILNRVKSGKYSDSICGVVYQRGQFSFTWDRRPDRPREMAAWETAQAIAVIAATDNWRPIAPKAMSFHARRVAPGWRNMERVSVIGNHVFYAYR
ncbi:MAG: cell wall hydrolase [Alphaproteobacteria bacterium]|nr:cell wall hydrolase [Alphaproteobacteria bacterium]